MIDDHMRVLDTINTESQSDETTLEKVLRVTLWDQRATWDNCSAQKNTIHQVTTI